MNLLAHSISGFLNQKIDLSRRASVIARGIAILLIMLHNLVHIFPGIINECEFDFNPYLNQSFFEHLDLKNPHLIYDLLSFIGWYGVPVFIFLSGFGLARKYGRNPEFKTRSFIRNNWKKLFLLMLPAVIIFCCGEVYESFRNSAPINFTSLIRMAIPLTELNGFFECVWSTVPGVYWYLGLTFELYLIYALSVRGKSLIYIWFLTIICYVVTVIMVYHPEASINGMSWVHYLRHNFTGWMLPFAIGLSFGRSSGIRLYQILIAVIICGILFLPLLNNPVGWQAAAVSAVVVIIFAAMLIDKIPYVSNIFWWVGAYSAYIYIVHPIVRHLMGRTVYDVSVAGATPDLSIISIYVVCVLPVAVIYKLIIGYISSIGKRSE